MDEAAQQFGQVLDGITFGNTGDRTFTQPSTQAPTPAPPVDQRYLSPPPDPMLQALQAIARAQDALAARLPPANQNQGAPQVVVQGHQEILKPSKFKGERGLGAANFLMEIKSYLMRHNQDYPTINDKVWFALMHMEDRAADWKHRYLSLLTEGHTPFVDWDEFTEAFKLSFERIEDEAEAMAEIKRYRQKNLPVAEYHSHFDTLAGRTKMSNYDKRERFYDGLNDQIKDALAQTSKDISTYSRIVPVSIELDNRLSQRNWERGQYRDRQNFTPNRLPTLVRPLPQIPFNTAPARDPQAMEIDASRACYNCGKVGHFRRNCRAPPKLARAGQQIRATGQEEAPPPPTPVPNHAAYIATITTLTKRMEQMEKALLAKEQGF